MVVIVGNHFYDEPRVVAIADNKTQAEKAIRAKGYKWNSRFGNFVLIKKGYDEGDYLSIKDIPHVGTNEDWI